MSNAGPRIWITPFSKLRPNHHTDIDCLSVQEVARAKRYRFEQDRVDSIVSRATLRRALASELDCDPATIAFEYGEFGKPSIRQTLFFNLSHCKTHLAITVSDASAIGIDVEMVNDRIVPIELAQTCFSRTERAELATFEQPRDQLRAFFRGWTRKEAFIKALGYGLQAPLDQFDVRLNNDEENALSSSRISGSPAADWKILNIPIDAQTCAAVCVSAREALPQILGEFG